MCYKINKNIFSYFLTSFINDATDVHREVNIYSHPLHFSLTSFSFVDRFQKRLSLFFAATKGE